VLTEVDFDSLLMGGLLSFLLFAGALHINVNELLQERWTILILATVGIVVSTFLIGTAVFWMLALLGIPIPYIYALLFGAVVSPTDPIAVLGLLKRANAPKSLEVLISGESLFNDGVGVVVFAIILSIAAGGGEIAAAEVGVLFLEEAVGGVLYGLVLGWLAYALLRRVDNYTIEILITLAVVTGGYALAGRLHTSGPLAVVVAGIMIGNKGRLFAMSERTREHLDTFWLVVDETLNAILFVLIGLEVLILRVAPGYVVAGVLAIPIALALSVPPSPQRDLLIVMTYAVVVFSILVQGLTVAPLARRARPDGVRGAPATDHGLQGVGAAH
jgi:CPA1 family monovalent cation:H+ antiporter